MATDSQNAGGTSDVAQKIARHQRYLAMDLEALTKLYKAKARQFRDLNDETAEIREALVAKQEIAKKEAELVAVKGKFARNASTGGGL